MISGKPLNHAKKTNAIKQHNAQQNYHLLHLVADEKGQDQTSGGEFQHQNSNQKHHWKQSNRQIIIHYKNI